MKDKIHKALNITPLQNEQWENIIETFREILKVKGRGSQKGKLNSHYGKKHSEETKKILSEKAKSRKTHGFQGKTHSEETRELISEKVKGRVSPMLGKEPWNKGSKMPDGFGEKIRQKKLGKKRSEETKEKLRVSSKNRKRLTCEHCRKNVDISNFVRWHGDKCKNVKNT
jgi:hypothetical protein